MSLNIVNVSIPAKAGEQKFLLLTLFMMVAFVGCSSSSKSSTNTSAASSIAAPAAPATISAVAGSGSVSLTWSAVSTATSYNVYRSNTATIAGPAIAATSQTTATDQNLAAGTYYYAVTAVNSGGESAYSTVISSTPVISSPTTTTTTTTTTNTTSPATITITGTIRYQDKEYGLSGFTGNQPYKPVRYATVELVSAASSAVLASSTTDASGVYSMTTGTAGTVHMRVDSQASPSGGSVPNVEVENLSGQVYAQASADFTAAGNATVDISIPSSSIGGAFNILDVFTNGLQYVQSVSGTYPGTTLRGFWSANNCEGTYFDGTGIYILNDPNGTCPYDGGTPDTDEYDDDVLYHEFGHFIAAQFSKDDSQGGQHMLSNNDLDMRLTWSEGWGDSMPGQVKRWLSATSQQNLLSSASGVPLSEYVDTYSTTAFAFDMGGIHGAPYVYACNEAAVAKILLDLYSQVGVQNVWDVFTSFKTNNPLTLVNLELFWDRWNSIESADTFSTVSSIFSAKSVTYSNLATNTTFTTAVPLSASSPVIYNLYPEGSADYFSFAAVANQTYTVTTSGLKNGADTVVFVYKPDQTLLTENDNTNGTVYSGSLVPSAVWPNLLCDMYGICHDNRGDILGSKVSFTPTTSGTYYITVQSSPGRPVSAGRYGTYTLTVQ